MANKKVISSQNTPLTMADLMAAGYTKPVSVNRGDSIEGKIIMISETEIVVDFGAKAEGVIHKKELAPDRLKTLKVGDTIEAFVAVPENESGQVVLTIYKQSLIRTDTGRGGKKGAEQVKKWQKFIKLMDQKTSVKGEVVEINKGGLMVEVDGIRGFVPSSQVSLDALSSLENFTALVGKSLPLTVIEVDPNSNRLIFSARTKPSETVKEKLNQYSQGQEITGKISAIVPFGLFINLDGVEGVVFSQEASWEEVDLPTAFKVGQEITAKVLSKDENLARINLSIRQLSEDPFEKLLSGFEADDVVSGKVVKVTPAGVEVELKDKVDGFIPAESTQMGDYEVGKETNFLVAGVDEKKRRVTLAPFITTTKGLIYK